MSIRKVTRMASKRRTSCPTTSTPRRKASNSHPGKRCMRPGPVSRNPYLNFLRQFRKKCLNLSATETVKKGAEEWRSMSKEDKLPYIVEAFYAPIRRRNLCKPTDRYKAHKMPRKSRSNLNRRRTKSKIRRRV